MLGHGQAQRLEFDAQHRAGGGGLRHARRLGHARHLGRRRQRQARDLRRFFREVIEHQQAPQVLQHAGAECLVRVGARWAQRVSHQPRHTSSAQGAFEQHGRFAATAAQQGARPRTQTLRRRIHAVHAHQKHRTAHRAHRALAVAMELHRVDHAQQLAHQGRVLHDQVDHFVDALAFHAGQLAHASRQTFAPRQGADAIEPVEQQGQRPRRILRVDFEPAMQGSQQGTRAEVALARLAIGGAVDDGAQCVGHGMRRGPGQAHDLAPHPAGSLGQIGVIQRGVSGQQSVQQEPEGQQVAFTGIALAAQLRGVRRGAVVAAHGLRGSGRSVRVGHEHPHRQTQQRGAALRIEHHMMQADIQVGHARFVRVGQPFEQIATPPGHGPRGRRAAGQLFGQGREIAQVVQRKRPAILHADLDGVQQTGVVQTGRALHRVQPTLDRGRGRGAARQAQQHLGIKAAVKAHPGHRAGTLAQQVTQLETPQSGGKRAGGGNHAA